MIDEAREYTFTSTVESPSGVRITVTTKVPAAHLSYDNDKNLASDVSELTQMGANQAAQRIAHAIKTHHERLPF